MGPTVDALTIRLDGTYVDATFGAGGHSALILAALGAAGRLIALDADPSAGARAIADPRFTLINANFRDLASVLDALAIERFDGVLFDLGVSSMQFDEGERGFSFRTAAPLDMRMDPTRGESAADLLATRDERELADLIYEYGEEKKSRRIARGIVAARPLDTTRQLVDVIRAAIPPPARRRGAHPARRTFQAIRMEVNRELPNLADGLDDSVHVIGPEGRVLVLAYHSLEDRMVKEKFAEWADTGAAPALPKLAIPEPKRNPLVRLLTRRPLRPRADEVAANRRAESVRLRAVERLPGSA